MENYVTSTFHPTMYFSRNYGKNTWWAEMYLLRNFSIEFLRNILPTFLSIVSLPFLHEPLVPWLEKARHTPPLHLFPWLLSINRVDIHVQCVDSRCRSFPAHFGSRFCIVHKCSLLLWKYRTKFLLEYTFYQNIFIG